jgi:hypothetical protein
MWKRRPGCYRRRMIGLTLMVRRIARRGRSQRWYDIAFSYAAIDLAAGRRRADTPAPFSFYQTV